MSIEKYSLVEAIRAIRFTRIKEDVISIEIGQLSLHYVFDYQPILYVPMSYADIYRTIRIDNKPIEKYSQKLYADEDVILKLGEELDPTKCETILEDRQTITVVLASLYQDLIT